MISYVHMHLSCLNRHRYHLILVLRRYLVVNVFLPSCSLSFIRLSLLSMVLRFVFFFDVFACVVLSVFGMLCFVLTCLQSCSGCFVFVCAIGAMLCNAMRWRCNLVLCDPIWCICDTIWCNSMQCDTKPWNGNAIATLPCITCNALWPNAIYWRCAYSHP